MDESVRLRESGKDARGFAARITAKASDRKPQDGRFAAGDVALIVTQRFQRRAGLAMRAGFGRRDVLRQALREVLLGIDGKFYDELHPHESNAWL